MDYAAHDIHKHVAALLRAIHSMLDMVQSLQAANVPVQRRGSYLGYDARDKKDFNLEGMYVAIVIIVTIPFSYSYAHTYAYTNTYTYTSFSMYIYTYMHLHIHTLVHTHHQYTMHIHIHMLSGYDEFEDEFQAALQARETRQENMLVYVLLCTQCMSYPHDILDAYIHNSRDHYASHHTPYPDYIHHHHTDDDASTPHTIHDILQQLDHDPDLFHTTTLHVLHGLVDMALALACTALEDCAQQAVKFIVMLAAQVPVISADIPSNEVCMDMDMGMGMGMDMRFICCFYVLLHLRRLCTYSSWPTAPRWVRGN
ncbi:hypothetical protein EON65_10895 [archaeon]|nr:MAG: hypothetical protein EON65_10895 [archaeon]